MGWMRMDPQNQTIKRRYLEICSKVQLLSDRVYIFYITVYLLSCFLQGDSPVSDRLEGTSNYNYRVVKEVCSFIFYKSAVGLNNK